MLHIPAMGTQRRGLKGGFEPRKVAVAEHLAVGCPLKATVRLAKVHPSVVRRLNGKIGDHAQAFHEKRVQEREMRDDLT